MESVMIVVPAGYEAEVKTRLGDVGPVQVGAGGVLVIDDGRSRVYVARNEHALEELEPSELAQFRDAVPDPIVLSVEFSDIALCRRVLEAIADDPAVMVDNDHGVVLPGPEFVRVLRSQQDWDWRVDRP
jgi:hypothetical protein